MSLQGNWAELNSALKTVRVHWEQTQEQWRDTVQKDFESRYWTPLESQVTAVLQAMDRLGPILERALRESS